MVLLGAYLKLVRWPNLFFIALTQFLFAFAFGFEFNQRSTGLFVVLMIASVLIAAAGYIINDYFDIRIDRINKPQRLIVGKLMKRRWAIMWHLLLSLTGIGFSIWISMELKAPAIAIGNTISVILLWLYSASFKRQLLVGNLIIALLTSWVIVVCYLFFGGPLLGLPLRTNPSGDSVVTFFQAAFFYAAFAFITTIIREAVKDIEDMEGDRADGCRTMPIVWGLRTAKMYTAVWTGSAIIALLLLAGYMSVFGLTLSWIVVLAFLILPSMYFLLQLKRAKSTLDFHRLSKLIKIIMLAGILTMLIPNFLPFNLN